MLDYHHTFYTMQFARVSRFSSTQLLVMFARHPCDRPLPFPPQTTLGGIQDEVVEALGNKNPSVKTETLLFLSRCFQQCTPALLPKPLLKAFCPLTVQVSGRKWGERREWERGRVSEKRNGKRGEEGRLSPITITDSMSSVTNSC